MNIDRIFKLSERRTDIKTEILAGFTTFAAMSYILAVNPSILAATGMDKAGLITVTALTAAFSTLVMALLTNLPIAVAPAMGTNAYFAFIVCGLLGLSWQEALALTFYNGIFFLVISLSGLREKILYGIPATLHVGLQCGIGLFICFLGLQSAKIIVPSPATMIQMGEIRTPEALFSLAGLGLMSVLICKKMRGAIITSILFMTFCGVFITGSDSQPITKFTGDIFSLPHGISQTFLAMDLGFPFREFSKAIPIILTLLMLDMFDTIGTVIALGRRTGLMDAQGRMPKLGQTLTADSIATIAGAALGTSTASAYVESSAGIESGGRTGLTSIVVAALFILALFFNPLITLIPAAALAPALIMVGIMMLEGMRRINFDDYAELIPAAFCMVMIMLSFRITEGFAMGLVAYVVISFATGKARRIKPITWMLFAVMCAFLASYHT